MDDRQEAAFNVILEVGLKRHAEELDRIGKLPDRKQQGYEVAPIICEIGNCTPWELWDATLVNYPKDSANALRDDGIIQWCSEQVNKENGNGH